jgi:hypothetical protein
MKLQTFKLALIAIACSTTVCFTACNKSKKVKDAATDNDTSMTKDNALGEFAYNDVGNIADEAGAVASGDNLNNYKTTSNCATVTKDTISIPHAVTIDFGLTNCLCSDNRNRRGKIIITYTGSYVDSGSVRTITFNNYHVNDNKILGTKTVTNMGHNANGKIYHSVIVNGLIIKAITGDSITWNSARTRTWILGDNTSTKTDDEFQITGSGSGQKANGNTYTMLITQPLIKARACDWIKAGEIQVTPSTGNIKTVNYGNGNCDDQATVTINGNTYNITLN